MATQTLYGLGIEKIIKQDLDWVNDDIRVALATSAFTPNQDTDEFWSTISSYEASGTAYVAGGELLTNKTIVYDAGTNEIRLNADDVSWELSTITARWALIYKDSGDPATSALIGFVNFGSDKSSDNGAFALTFSANSVFKAVVAEAS